MQTWLFYICLRGIGDSKEEAYMDALDGFAADPGPPPSRELTSAASAVLEARLEDGEFSIPLACRHPDDELAQEEDEYDTDS